MLREKCHYRLIILAASLVFFTPLPAHAAPCPSDGAGGVNNAGGACEATGATNRITADNGPGNTITASDITVTVPYNEAVSALNGSGVTFGQNVLIQDTGGGGFVGLYANGTDSVIDARSDGLQMNLENAARGAYALNGGQIFLGSGSLMDVTPSGGVSMLRADGTDSFISATGSRFTGATWGGDVAFLATNGGTINVSDSDIELATGGGGLAGVEADGTDSTMQLSNVNISAIGTGGNAVGMLATGGAFMSLTGGSVNVVGGGGSAALRASGTGTILSVANPDIHMTADNSAAMELQDGAQISVTGGSVTATGTNAAGMRISGGGTNTNRLVMQNTSLNSTSDSFRVEGNSVADISIRNMSVTNNNDNLLSADGDVEFTASAVTMRGRILTLAGTNYVDLGNASLWTITGNSNVTGFESTSSTTAFAAPTGDPTQLASYLTLTVGSMDYNSNFGELVLNTYLGADGSPSDRLIISGAGSEATGITLLSIKNTGGPGAETTGDGILVVDAQGGATTQSNAFELANDVRSGAYDYYLFRGGADGVSNPDDWFLRSTFTITTPGPPSPIPLPTFPVLPARPLPIPAPGGTLPPGTYPIIGKDVPAYGVVQPLALEAGLTVLGTLHERIGDTMTRANLGNDNNARGWGRLIAQHVDNRYSAFANPTARGAMAGFQVGEDIFNRQDTTGGRDAGGFYLAYLHNDFSMDGIITNADATGYAREDVGDMNLNAYSFAGYWTHYGAHREWYVNAVLQGTYYDGDTTTPDDTLPLRGNGLLGSIEAGAPIKLPLGRRFVLEPQAQAIWQRVKFSAKNDGDGEVNLGTTHMTTTRLGLRGQWTRTTDNGTVWQPYMRINYWRDWGNNAQVLFDSDPAPLVIKGQRMEYAGGLSIKSGKHLSFYGQGGFQQGLGEKAYERRRIISGSIGLRYAW